MLLLPSFTRLTTMRAHPILASLLVPLLLSACRVEAPPEGTAAADAAASFVPEGAPAATPAGPADSAGYRIATRIPTYQGVVTIEQQGGPEDPDRPRRFRVAVDGAAMLEDSTALDVSVYALSRSPALGMGTVVVLEAASGGTACPSLFRILELSDDAPPVLTDEFGDCSDIPAVAFDSGAVAVRFPGFYTNVAASEPGFRQPPPVTWTYRGAGKLERAEGR
jgi:hypothetical protein